MMEKSARGKRDVWLVTLLPSAVQTSTITIPDVNYINLICCETSDRFWVSGESKLLKVDSRGNVLIRLVVGLSGMSTNTDGELMFTTGNSVEKIESNGIITTLFSTNDIIKCIYSSCINGDILLGLNNTALDTSKVTRYDVTGQKILDIEDQGVKLYNYPSYITENINGDIWTSDTVKVVVVNKSGKHRFNYRGHQSHYFNPKGICTDILGHVLVCNSSLFRPSVHLLDQDGQFLSLLLTKEHNIHDPRSVCVDDKHNLYLGQYGRNKIRVYKYIQVSDK
ncbi:uncharacterized protein LOC134282330 [Saccostrea cucullata]|uniref:uncharacterized protein LOC134282330 n=1 Tax=Saccostrea cuccullata TaxID=36930 RepID=UPI002ED4072B